MMQISFAVSVNDNEQMADEAEKIIKEMRTGHEEIIAEVV